MRELEARCGKMWLCRAGAGRKAWQVKSGGVTGAQNLAVGYNDGDAGISWLFVGVG
jgi:hypothetical protein